MFSLFSVIKWHCEAGIGKQYRIEVIDFTCEGYDHPRDQFVLKGSCTVCFIIKLPFMKLILLRSSVSTEDLIVILRFLFLLIIFFFLTPFLQNAWTDFHEIFRDNVYWPGKTENIFSYDDVTSGLRY